MKIKTTVSMTHKEQEVQDKHVIGNGLYIAATEEGQSAWEEQQTTKGKGEFKEALDHAFTRATLRGKDTKIAMEKAKLFFGNDLFEHKPLEPLIRDKRKEIERKKVQEKRKRTRTAEDNESEVIDTDANTKEAKSTLIVTLTTKKTRIEKKLFKKAKILDPNVEDSNLDEGKGDANAIGTRGPIPKEWQSKETGIDHIKLILQTI